MENHAVTSTRSQPQSYAVELRLPDEPCVIRAVYNFAAREDAQSWGQAASLYLLGFIEVTGWRVIGSQEPPTHTLKDGRAIRLGSILRQ